MKNSFKKIIYFFTLFISIQSFSQFHTMNVWTPSSGISGFEYNGLHYEANPKGMTKFLNETEISDDLKNKLQNQIKRIKKKKNISDVFLYSGMGVGLGIFANQGIKALDDDDEMDSSQLFLGLGIFALGGTMKWAIMPKKKDYYEFFNTFNSKHKKKIIEVGVTINYSDKMNCGIAVTL